MNEFKLSAWRLLAAASLTLLIAGCNNNSPTQTGTTASTSGSSTEIVLRRGNGVEPDSLNPQLNTNLETHRIIGDMLMGLTTEGPDAKPIPGAAESWETSSDGLTWTFHLRNHTWSDGMPVTADDFVFAWRRMVDPKTAAPYALMLYLFKNGRAINSGKMPPDTLGVRAIDEHTLELTLETPASYLPQLLMHDSVYPLPKHVLEAKGKDWVKPGNYVSNGAYVLNEWVPNERITLVKNPRFYDASNVRIDKVVFFPITDPDAGFKRYRAGDLDIQDPLPPSQIDWAKANMPDQLHVDPQLMASYAILNLRRDAFKDKRVREAFNLAYDRETMVNKVLRLGQPPSYSLVPPGVVNYPGGVELSFKSMPFADRIKRAQDLMRQAGYGPGKPLKTSYFTTTSNDAKRLAAVLQQMWKVIYADVEIMQSDPQSYSQKLENGDYDIVAFSWLADYNDAYNFLFLLMTDNPGLNYARYSNPTYDALMMQSSQELDLQKRGALMAQAEKIALEDSAVIPTRFQVTLNVVQTYIKGWITNPSDSHFDRWLSIEKPTAAQ